MENKPMPHSEEAEKVVLGSIMTDRGTLSEIRDILTPECFYDPFHRSIYEAIIEIDKRGERPDLISVTNEMMKNGEVDMYRLSVISYCQSFDVYQHAALLHDKEKRRRFIGIGNRLISGAFSEAEDIVDILSDAEDKRISSRFRLFVKVWHSSPRFDLDNSLKTLLDCLQSVNAITDDNLCYQIEAEKHIDKHHPRVEFALLEVNEQKNIFQ